MFAKKARALNYRGDFGLRRNTAAVRPGNDNRPVRLIARRRPKRRPALFCRWHETSAGMLECRWHSEALAASGGKSRGQVGAVNHYTRPKC
jgi:hypothetical protein